MNKENVYVYGIIMCAFLIPIVLFIAVVICFLPSPMGVMIIGLAGFTVMIVGPFWAMQLEKKLRDRFKNRTKRKTEENEP